MTEVTFSVLRQILLDLGFTFHIEPQKFARFDHAPSKTWFVFPAFREDQIVPKPHLIGTRRSLDERGLLPGAQFDERIRQLQVAG